jgi:FimV-like protein
MLVALFRNNENAFDGKNMNRLRSGQIISIPGADQAAAVPTAEAATEIKVQSADWRAYRDRVAGAAPVTDGTQSRQSSSGRIGTTVEDKAGATQSGGDKLQVSRAATTGAGAAAAGAIAKAEDATANTKALRDANARITELEKTVKDLQKAAAAQPDDGRSPGACCGSGQGQGAGTAEDGSAEGRASQGGSGGTAGGHAACSATDTRAVRRDAAASDADARTRDAAGTGTRTCGDARTGSEGTCFPASRTGGERGTEG